MRKLAIYIYVYVYLYIICIQRLQWGLTVWFWFEIEKVVQSCYAGGPPCSLCSSRLYPTAYSWHGGLLEFAQIWLVKGMSKWMVLGTSCVLASCFFYFLRCGPQPLCSQLFSATLATLFLALLLFSYSRYFIFSHATDSYSSWFVLNFSQLRQLYPTLAYFRLLQLLYSQLSATLFSTTLLSPTLAIPFSATKHKHDLPAIRENEHLVRDFRQISGNTLFQFFSTTLLSITFLQHPSPTLL